MKETIIQFGEGAFLRSFVDYFVHGMNEQGIYDGKIVVVQPIENGLVSTLNEQNGEYNLFLRGVENDEVVNEHIKVTSISRGINPYTEYTKYLDLAEKEELRVIVSNTTEAGIEFIKTDQMTDVPPKSFPAKLTVLLYRRFEKKLPGFLILSCELIDKNGDCLKECVLQYARLWGLGKSFEDWIEKENHFCNTLVDRICTGYPVNQADTFRNLIGEEDKLLNTAEIFHLWVIEGDFEKELPLQKAGFHVIWTDDVAPYKKRKVRILNGGHTSMVLAAHLYGMKTVGDCMKNALVRSFLERAIFDEIVPTLGGTKEDIQFAQNVLERFSNPFVQHQLLSIALNSVSKFKTRVVPTILEYYEQRGQLPNCLSFSLAALITFYKTDMANDLPEIINFMKKASCDEILERKDYWGTDLGFMKETIQDYYDLITKRGMQKAYERLLEL